MCRRSAIGLWLYCEPPEFLAPEHRTVFEPVAFYGSISGLRTPSRSGVAGRPRPVDGHLRRAYALIWHDVPVGTAGKEALAALESIAAGMSHRGIETTSVSFGGSPIDDAARLALGRPGITLESYVDQARALDTADVFVTHHGFTSMQIQPPRSGTGCPDDLVSVLTDLAGNGQDL